MLFLFLKVAVNTQLLKDLDLNICLSGCWADDFYAGVEWDASNLVEAMTTVW